MKKTIDVIIFSGQSNMQGQSDILSDSNAVENAYEYRFLDDSFSPLKNPVGENIRYDHTAGEPITVNCNLGEWLKVHVVGSACYGHTNLVPEFCKAYSQAANTEVLAVHVAKGSTLIADWLPGTPGYDIIVEKASAAVRKAEEEYTVCHVFFVWLQGESDAIYGNSNGYYKEKLKELNASLKNSLNVEKFGIIRVGRFTGDARDDEIISAQDEICLEDDGFLMLTEIASTIDSGSEYIHPHIPGHFSAKGLEMIGSLAGQKLGEYVKEQ